LSGASNAWLSGENLGDGLVSGLEAGGYGAAIGGVIGGLTGGIDAYRKDLNLWNGGPNIEDKLKIVVARNKNELLNEIGEAGVSDVLVGNKTNLKGTNYSKSGGYLYGPEGKANAFTDNGSAFDQTFDGYARFDNNKIFFGKHAVRQMYREVPGATETLFHEWFHAGDYYSGSASYFNYKHPYTYTSMLEFRAHSFNYMRFPTQERLLLMEHYGRLFNGFPGLY
jgi:hypothetical protein